MILITRPLENSIRTLKKLEALGLTGKIFPLLEINFDRLAIQNIDFNAAEIIVVTSQSAYKALKNFKISFNKPVLVVGQRTGELLKDSGYNIRAIRNTASELLDYIERNISRNKKLLYLSGDHIASDLDTKLLELGFNLERKIIYSSVAVKAMPESILQNVDKILFYSPRTAKIFTEVCPNKLDTVSAVCISNNTAKMLNNLKLKAVYVVQSPTEKDMLDLLLI